MSSDAKESADQSQKSAPSIIAHGNVIDGMSFIGTFETPEMAHVYVDWAKIDGTWWVVQIDAPNPEWLKQWSAPKEQLNVALEKARMIEESTANAELREPRPITEVEGVTRRLMKNPRGEVYGVYDPTTDETGIHKVPEGYWAPAAEPGKPRTIPLAEFEANYNEAEDDLYPNWSESTVTIMKRFKVNTNAPHADWLRVPVPRALMRAIWERGAASADRSVLDM